MTLTKGPLELRAGFSLLVSPAWLWMTVRWLEDGVACLNACVELSTLLIQTARRAPGAGSEGQGHCGRAQPPIPRDPRGRRPRPLQNPPLLEVLQPQAEEELGVGRGFQTRRRSHRISNRKNGGEPKNAAGPKKTCSNQL
ncbi:expressed unknown protein [Ectocarpus siliculosus]|uniref:Uncharacterized protein n=1 Tax=Ectocarpus siliculosus TaxID=2880 RepID=D7G4Y5_ECTSI|nr:expressed unknown protein [Ectocarpus siliculosus]|eukprot:CBJ33748.1 expressed unknown protein [Ectocarpus siliculosus]